MKFLLFIVLIFLGNSFLAQSNCKPYVPVTKGTIWEVTNYSAKGKETGKIVYELINAVKTDSNSTFTIKSISFDKKGKETFTNEFDATCVNGKFEFDMSFMMDGEAMQAYKDMDIDVDATEFEIPTMDSDVGTRLSDGSLQVKVGMNGMSMFKMTVLVTNRKVESKGDKTTPAGTFKCVEISQDINTKMIVKIEASTKEWYAEEIGIVRSESYNKKGKLTGYSELTKLDRK